MIQVNPVETSRLLVRPLVVEDVTEGYVRWLNQPEVSKYLEARFSTHSLESVRAYVASMCASSSALHCGLFLRESSIVHVGTVTLPKIDYPHKVAELSYVIGRKEYWGKGLGTEAVNAGCQIAFNQLEIRKIQAGVYASNIGSQKALQKNGFLIEGRLRERFIGADGQLEDHIWMGLLRRDFRPLPKENGCA